MKKSRFAIIGTGFWAPVQMAGWNELEDVECVAVYNRTRSKAEDFAAKFNIPSVYDSVETLLQKETLDFVDIITNVESHADLTRIAANNGVAVVCQKPMATTLEEAHSMAEHCKSKNVSLLINENWRWQHPIRELKKALKSNGIGTVFRARIDYINSFPVFENQPFLKELEQFILTDIGTHILDTARFLFGEATSLTCRTHRIHPDIKGEDVATVMLGMQGDLTVTCNMSYASRVEHDRFPETFIFIEGSKGSIELSPDFWLRITTETGTQSRRCPPPFYPWVDPRYALVQSSIVDCQRNLLNSIQTRSPAETSGEDNLKTLKLVFGAYESGATRKTIFLNHA